MQALPPRHWIYSLERRRRGVAERGGIERMWSRTGPSSSARILTWRLRAAETACGYRRRRRPGRSCDGCRSTSHRAAPEAGTARSSSPRRHAAAARPRGVAGQPRRAVPPQRCRLPACFRSCRRAHLLIAVRFGRAVVAIVHRSPSNLFASSHSKPLGGSPHRYQVGGHQMTCRDTRRQSRGVLYRRDSVRSRPWLRLRPTAPDRPKRRWDGSGAESMGPLEMERWVWEQLSPWLA